MFLLVYDNKKKNQIIFMYIIAHYIFLIMYSYHCTFNQTNFLFYYIMDGIIINGWNWTDNSIKSLIIFLNLILKSTLTICFSFLWCLNDGLYKVLTCVLRDLFGLQAGQLV